MHCLSNYNHVHVHVCGIMAVVLNKEKENSVTGAVPSFHRTLLAMFEKAASAILHFERIGRTSNSKDQSLKCKAVHFLH